MLPCLPAQNGGLTSGQLAWLDQQLAGAEHAGEKVIVASHHPIGRGSARPTHMAWNAPDMEKKLTDSRWVLLHRYIVWYIVCYIVCYIW